MTTRPRRESSSGSLAAAMQVKAQKDSIGDDRTKPIVRLDREVTDHEARKMSAKSPKGGSSSTSSASNTTTAQGTPEKEKTSSSSNPPTVPEKEKADSSKPEIEKVVK